MPENLGNSPGSGGQGNARPDAKRGSKRPALKPKTSFSKTRQKQNAQRKSTDKLTDAGTLCRANSDSSIQTAWAVGAYAKDWITKAPWCSEDERAVLLAQVTSLAKADQKCQKLPTDPAAPVIVRDSKDLKLAAGLMLDAREIVIDIETSTLDPRIGEIVGIGVSIEGSNFYIPTAHRGSDNMLRPDQLPLITAVELLGLDKLKLIAHNCKFELRWLRRHTGVTCNFIWDTMLAAQLMHSHLSADLKSLASRILDVPDWSLPKEEMKAIQSQPIERVARYCCLDTYHTLQLYRSQLQWLS